MAVLLRATTSAAFCLLGLVMGPAATLGAEPQEPTKDLPVSLDRIREELAKTPAAGLELDMPVHVPVAVFKTRVEQRVYVLSLEEWLEKEFKLTKLQRQSADWAAKCCGYALAGPSSGSGRDPLFKSLQNALEGRKVRKLRARIARELAEVEAARSLSPPESPPADVRPDTP